MSLFQHIDVFLNEYFTIPHRYQFIKFLGRGTQGFVIRAFDNVTQREVVIKKIDLPEDTTNRTPFKRAARELNCMMHFRHPNVIGFLSAFTPYSNAQSMREFYIVRENMGGTMRQLIPEDMDHYVAKKVLHDLCRGVQALHRVGIAHRDLKPSNILISENIDVKLCDFGQSNTADPFMATQYVVMRYYRAPEIVCHVQGWSHTTVDVWSIGCILAELFTDSVMFVGNDHVDQYAKIIQKLGTPSVRFFNRMPQNVQNFVLSLPHYPQRSFDDIFPNESFLRNYLEEPEVCRQAKDLLSRMLVIDPDERITLDQVLRHPYLVDVSNESGMDNFIPSDQFLNNFTWQNYIDGSSHREEIFNTLQQYRTDHDIFNDVELPHDFN